MDVESERLRVSSSLLVFSELETLCYPLLFPFLFLSIVTVITISFRHEPPCFCFPGSSDILRTIKCPEEAVAEVEAVEEGLVGEEGLAEVPVSRPWGLRSQISRTCLGNRQICIQ